MQNVLVVLGPAEELLVRLLIDGVIIIKNSKHQLKSIAWFCLIYLIIIGFFYIHLSDIATVGFFCNEYRVINFFDADSRYPICWTNWNNFNG